MKILVYPLYVSLLFFEWCSTEDSCTSLPSSIDTKVYFNLWDSSPNHEACESKWLVKFYKEHCEGNVSGEMEYDYESCHEDDGAVILNRVGIGNWEITFENEEDYLNIFIYKSTNQVVEAMFSLTGKEIYNRTQQGSSSLVIDFFYEDGKWEW